MQWQYAAVTLALVLTLAHKSQGHGYLLDPAGRSSMWRVHKFKSLVVPNYNDMGLRCGGSRTDCGICGDHVDGPYDNEAGGRFASGIIAKNYVEGQTISVTVVVTANHEGWFSFHLCPNNDPTKRATEECLMSNVLRLSNGDESYHLAEDQYGKTHMEVVLPEGVTCSQCVFRWKWITETTSAEQFVGCADISISPRDGSPPRTVRPETVRPVVIQTEEPITKPPVTVQPITEEPVTERPITEEPITERPITEESITERPITEDPVTEAPPTEFPSTEEPITPVPTRRPFKGKTWRPFVHGVRVKLVCGAVGVWEKDDEMIEWCNNNCNNSQYYCPPELCLCVERL